MWLELSQRWLQSVHLLVRHELCSRLLPPSARPLQLHNPVFATASSDCGDSCSLPSALPRSLPRALPSSLRLLHWHGSVHNHQHTSGGAWWWMRWQQLVRMWADSRGQAVRRESCTASGAQRCRKKIGQRQNRAAPQVKPFIIPFTDNARFRVELNKYSQASLQSEEECSVQLWDGEQPLVKLSNTQPVAELKAHSKGVRDVRMTQQGGCAGGEEVIRFE